MGMRCKDCGEILTDSNQTKMTRLSICDDCWDLRTIFVKRMNEGRVSQQQLERVQRTTVQAKRFKEVLGEIGE